MSSARLIRVADLPARPWKNGGGVTYEIAVFPEGAGFEDFLWRLSMAEVASDGPFSAFAGIDRVLTLIEGPGIVLDFGGGSLRLDPGAPPLAFPGEAAVTGRLVAGPVLDLNVMTRRGRMSAEVGLRSAGEALPAGVTAALCRSERARVGGFDLGRGDGLMDPGPARVESGTVIAVSLRPCG